MNTKIIINEETRNSYAEVLEILKYVNKDDYNKIPSKEIEVLKINSNKNYEFNYDPSKSLNDQDILERTKLIIAMFFCDYWANEEQKKKIFAYDKEYERQQELEKSENYNTYNIFKKRNQENEIEENIIQNEVALVEYKESIFKKFINKIKRIFNI